jgi:hypothetical protein
MSNQTTQFVGGVLNMTGVRPGNAFKYEGPTMPGMTYFTLTFTSTHDAIEKLIVPPPLKIDRDLPPEVRAMYFINRNNRAFDGRVTPYHAFQFMAHVKRGSRRASAGWEYVDGIHNDKTEMDIMGPWGVYFGVLKKMADIRFLPAGIDSFEITVTRRGARMVTMRLRLREELSKDQLSLVNEGIGKSGGTMTVREIPDCTYTRFVDRAICWTPTNGTKIDRAWAAGDGSIEFGHLELDPLDEMPVLEVKNAFCYELSTGKPVLNELVVIEELPCSA